MGYGVNDAASQKKRIKKLISRILIVGYGSIGKRHLRIARFLLPTADIRILRHKKSNDIPIGANGCFFNIKQALEFAPNLSILANPASQHIYIARQLIRVRSHIFIEKPISIDAKDVSDLIKACSQESLMLAVGYNMRFKDSLKKFRELIHSNVAGTILSVRAEVGQYLPSWRPGIDYRKSVSAVKALGGGVLLELSHELDYLSWIFGDVEWVTAVLSRQGMLEIDVEDTAHLVLGFLPKEGKTQQLTASVNLDFIRHDFTRFCVAIGELGTLRIDLILNKIFFLKAGNLEWEELYVGSQNPDDSYIEEWRNLLLCVLGRKNDSISGAEALNVMHVIGAAKRSSDAGLRIKLSKQD